MKKIKHLIKYKNITLFGCQMFIGEFGFYKKPFEEGLKHILDWQMKIGWITINRWKDGIEPNP